VRGVVASAVHLVNTDREDASSMVTAGATANTTMKNGCASRESGLLCSHSHGESIDTGGGGGGYGLTRLLSHQ